MDFKKPHKILIIDAYCPSHVGNDALLENSIRIIKQIFPDSELMIHAKKSNVFEDTLQVKCKPRLFPDPPSKFITKLRWIIAELLFMLTQYINMYTLKISPHKLAFGARKDVLKEYELSDISISIGGEMINDSFRKTLPLYLFMFWLAQKCGSKIIIFPQSIGPLKRFWTRALVRHVLQKCSIITARDRVSLEELQSLRLTNPSILLSPDVAVLQKMADKNDAKQYFHRLGVTMNKDKIWIGLTASNWVEDGVESQNYLHSIIDALVEITKFKNIGVIIMPANMPVYGNQPSEYNTSIQILDKLSPVCEAVILNPEVVSARLFKSMTRELDIFLTTRMHASILSTMAGTPTITINTQRKLKGFMTLISQGRYALDVTEITSENIIAAITDVMKRADIIRAELKEAQQKQIDDMNRYVERLREQVSGFVESNERYARQAI